MSGRRRRKGRFYLPLMRHPFCRYDYRLAPGKPFDRYGLEQQAQIVTPSLPRSTAGVPTPLAPPQELLPFGRRCVSEHVAVIGAGVFGAWTAHHLQQQGHRVTLVDAWGPAPVACLIGRRIAAYPRRLRQGRDLHPHGDGHRCRSGRR